MFIRKYFLSRAQQLAANNTRRTRSFNRVQQTDVDRYRAAQQLSLIHI